MRIFSRRYAELFIAMIFLLTVVACGGLPKTLKEQAKKVPEKIKTTEDIVNKLKDEYEQFKKTDTYQLEFIRYAGPERENWDNHFKKAVEELSHATNVFDTTVKAILKRNKEEEQLELRKQLKRVDDGIIYCRQLAQKTSLRIVELQKTKKNAAKIFEIAEEKKPQIDRIFEALEPVVRETQKEYPNKKEDLDTRFSWFMKTQDTSHSALLKARGEFNANKPDYGFFSDSCVLITNNLGAIKREDKVLRTKVKELPRSYSKILRDMKIEEKPWAEFVRYEWDNWSDWDTTRETQRQKKYISKDDYNTLLQRLGGEGGIISRGSSNEVWVEDLDIEEEFYHRYLLVENGEQRMGDWEQVKEDFYDIHEDNLNMSIVTKPVGLYEEEVIKVAMPPGFDKVGDPRYGSWVENKDTGKREWSFFQQYLFWNLILNGGRFNRGYYTHDRWNDWNRNYRGRRPYYGHSGGDFGSYGKSTKTNPNIRNTTFAKTGGLRATQPSVRGTGAAARTRGPGKGK